VPLLALPFARMRANQDGRARRRPDLFGRRQRRRDAALNKLVETRGVRGSR